MFLEWVSSNTIVSGLIGLITLIMIVYHYWWKLPHLRYPPGVRGIPILGALPFLGRFPGKVIKEWSLKKYGPVMSVRFGPNESVVLNDFESIHEALVKHRLIFQGRPTLKLIEDYSQGYGYGFADGHKKLLDVRNFTAKVLRGFGIGRREMEIRVSDVAQDLVQVLQDLNGIPTDIRMMVGATVCNVIASMVFGKTFERNDKAFLHIVQSIFDSFGDEQNSQYILTMLYFPGLRHIPPFKKAYKMFVEKHFEQLDFCRKEIEEHIKNLDENEPADFIDAFLIEIKKKSSKDSWFHHDQLLQCVADLFLAGTETSTTTLMWCLAVLLNYPDLQSVLYEEISRETGQKLPSVDHKENLPKLQAFIQEIYRNLTLLPLGLQHKTMADVELCGYHIPKDTVIFTNLHAVHSDSKTWKDPSKFDIYRHIDKNGKFVPSKKVIPFGIGARSCIGEKLAQTEIYLFLANIIKRFEILPDSESKHPPPLNDGVTGFAFTPFSFKVVLKIRHIG